MKFVQKGKFVTIIAYIKEICLNRILFCFMLWHITLWREHGTEKRLYLSSSLDFDLHLTFANSCFDKLLRICLSVFGLFHLT
jgi:hypothetical protein